MSLKKGITIVHAHDLGLDGIALRNVVRQILTSPEKTL